MLYLKPKPQPQNNILRLGINGFGRLGRLVLRHSITDCVEVVAINDPYLAPDKMAYLFKYDSTYGVFPGTVTFDAKARHLIVNGKVIKIFHGIKPAVIEWNLAGAEYILECTGLFTSLREAIYHKCGKAKKIIIAAQSPDVPMLVCGVNLRTYKKHMSVVSMGTGTTHCLAPLVAILNGSFEIVSGIMTTVQSVSGTQKTVDCRSRRLWRHGRGCLQNIIPVANGAAKAVSEIIPALKGKLTGMAIRVPTADVSVIDLNVCLAKETTYEEITTKIKEAADGYLKGILTYTDEENVSADFKGNTHSCVFDVASGVSVNNKLFKLVAWYDNDSAYAKRLIDLALYMHDKEMRGDKV